MKKGYMKTKHLKNHRLLPSGWKSYFLLLSLALLPHSPLHAQFQDSLWVGKQAYNWYFAEKAGLDFNTSPPTPLTNGQIPSYPSRSEGSGTISDADGNLLFYTNGATIWNKNHQVMQNGSGLLGHPSSTQSGLIVPKPGSSDIYYVFSMGRFEFSGEFNGLAYTEVDMNLDNGLGGVTNNKNIVLLASTLIEKLTAVYHANTDDVWVIGRSGTYQGPIGNNSHQIGSKFFSYLVSANGINTVPVESDIGGTDFTVLGQMKASPNGKKIVVSSGYDFSGNYGIKLFDFNNQTGEVSNPIDLSYMSPQLLFSYGVEFSPNSKYLYLGMSAGTVHQIDISLGSEAAIRNSLTPLSTSTHESISSLQLAPNGKIYIGSNKVDDKPIGSVSGFGSDTISVINYPNNPAAATGYLHEVIDLGGKYNEGNLPSFIQNYFESGILHEGNCPGPSEVRFSTIRIPGIQSIQWDYGDGSTGTGITPTHVYDQPGTYTVTATITSNGAEQTATTTIRILEGAEATAPDMLLACGENQAVFDLTSLNPAILNGQDPNTYTVSYHTSQNGAENDVDKITPADNYSSSTGTIYARVTNVDTGCYAITPVALENVPPPTAPDVAPLIACDTGALDGLGSFDLTLRAAALQENQTDTELAYFETQQDADNNTNAIPDPTAYANTGNPQRVYVRISRIGLPDCYVVASLDLEVEVADLVGTGLDLIGCSPFDLTAVEDGMQSDFTIAYYKSEADAMANTAALENPTAYPTAAQEEKVYVRITDSNGCADIAELHLITGDCEIPEGISPNGDGANDSFDLSFLTATYGGKHITIFNRYGTIVYERNDYSDQWAGQDKNGNLLPTGTYFYVLELGKPHPDYGSIIKKWVYVQREVN